MCTMSVCMQCMQSTVFAGATREATCGVNALLASLIPWSKLKRILVLILRWPAKFREKKCCGVEKEAATCLLEIDEPSPDKVLN